MAVSRFLVVRLGAMGDILHALPAAAALKRAHPGARLVWAVHPKWRDLLEDGPLADEAVLIDRTNVSSLTAAFASLRREQFDFAIDFQGLIKSALVTKAARAGVRYGFSRKQCRESAAAYLYTDARETAASHVVDRNIELATAAGAKPGAEPEFPLPQGRAEGELPLGKFVLASPLAGWVSKQWPTPHWAELAGLLHSSTPYRLVINGPPAAEAFVGKIPGALLHVSSVAGLIDATRRASAVIGLDSGPMHLAAALARPGVALFGPTDPERNGPYSAAIRVLRAPSAETTYARLDTSHPSMWRISPAEVFRALMEILEPSQ